MTALIKEYTLDFCTSCRKKEEEQKTGSCGLVLIANGLGTVTVKKEDLVRWFCLDRRPARFSRYGVRGPLVVCVGFCGE